MKSNSDIINEFDINSMPDLDTCVLAALELFSKTKLPNLNFSKYKRPIVIGSGNAEITGKILFHDQDAVFSNESKYKKTLENIKSIDCGIIISSSGGKHAPEIAEHLKKQEIDSWLLTCNPNPPAKKYLDEKKVLVFPKQREPYTYNTSTYMSMILAKTKEDPKNILDFILKIQLTDFSKYDGFYLMIPEKFDFIKDMFKIKFVEIFGRKIARDIFTKEQSKHATTVVESDSELFISFGFENNTWGRNRFNVPLPENLDYGTMMAIGYYIIGNIQKQKPPWFKQNIEKYCEKASNLFNEKISPIVE